MHTIEHVLNVGTSGQIKIVDKTDIPDLMLAEAWAKSSTPISIPQLAWDLSADSALPFWRSFNFSTTTEWQKLGTFYVAGAQSVTFHLGETGTDELDGPFSMTVALHGRDLFGNAIFFKEEGVWKRAVPYVKVDGAWKFVQSFSKTDGLWKEVS